MGDSREKIFTTCRLLSSSNSTFSNQLPVNNFTAITGKVFVQGQSVISKRTKQMRQWLSYEEKYSGLNYMFFFVFFVSGRGKQMDLTTREIWLVTKAGDYRQTEGKTRKKKKADTFAVILTVGCLLFCFERITRFVNFLRSENYVLNGKSLSFLLFFSFLFVSVSFVAIFLLIQVYCFQVLTSPLFFIKNPIYFIPRLL